MKRAIGGQATERLALERWVDEGGHVAPEAVIERESAAQAGGDRRRGQIVGSAERGTSTGDAASSMPRSAQNPVLPRVLIAGGGVAGLETLLALRALAADRLDVTILAPELKFVNRSMSVEQPFQRQRGRGLRLEDTAAELGARWHRGALDRVEHDQHRVVTKDRDELFYDRLVLALGARPERDWRSKGVLTYHGGRDAPNYRLLLHQLREGRIDKLAFVRPAGASWPLPLYDLALMTAADCAAHNRSDVELSLVTPEEEPLGIFGHPASAAIRQLLDESGVKLHTSSYGVPHPPGRLDVSPATAPWRLTASSPYPA